MTPPPIEQVRGAVAYLQQSLLDRLKDAGDDIDRLAELNDDATKILVAHSAVAVGEDDLRLQEEDRMRRGKIARLCGLCHQEIPITSQFEYDWGHLEFICETCVAATPAPLPDSPDE